jgi:hypothetical protein
MSFLHYRQDGFLKPTKVNWPDMIQVRTIVHFHWIGPWRLQAWRCRQKRPSYIARRWSEFTSWAIAYGTGASGHCGVETHGFWLRVLGFSFEVHHWTTGPEELAEQQAKVS